MRGLRNVETLLLTILFLVINFQSNSCTLGSSMSSLDSNDGSSPCSMRNFSTSTAKISSPNSCTSCTKVPICSLFLYTRKAGVASYLNLSLSPASRAAIAQNLTFHLGTSDQFIQKLSYVLLLCLCDAVTKERCFSKGGFFGWSHNLLNDGLAMG